jgi:hypothetical protein
MKHLRLELQKLEERIAPCGCSCGGSGGSHKSGGSHGSKGSGGSHHSGSHGSKSHGSKG